MSAIILTSSFKENIMYVDYSYEQQSFGKYYTIHTSNTFLTSQKMYIPNVRP